MPKKYYYLIDPSLNLEMKKVRVVEVKDCVYDSRIKVR